MSGSHSTCDRASASVAEVSLVKEFSSSLRLLRTFNCSTRPALSQGGIYLAYVRILADSQTRPLTASAVGTPLASQRHSAAHLCDSLASSISCKFHQIP